MFWSGNETGPPEPGTDPTVPLDCLIVLEPPFAVERPLCCGLKTSGFLGTGGAAFLLDKVDDDWRRPSAVVGCEPRDEVELPIVSSGGGSLRALTLPVDDAVVLNVFVVESLLMAGRKGRSTYTQSGSLVSVKGFDGLFGLRT